MDTLEKRESARLEERYFYGRSKRFSYGLALFSFRTKYTKSWEMLPLLDNENDKSRKSPTYYIVTLLTSYKVQNLSRRQVIRIQKILGRIVLMKHQVLRTKWKKCTAIRKEIYISSLDSKKNPLQYDSFGLSLTSKPPMTSSPWKLYLINCSATFCKFLEGNVLKSQKSIKISQNKVHVRCCN